MEFTQNLSETMAEYAGQSIQTNESCHDDSYSDHGNHSDSYSDAPTSY